MFQMMMSTEENHNNRTHKKVPKRGNVETPSGEVSEPFQIARCDNHVDMKESILGRQRGQIAGAKITGLGASKEQKEQ